MASSRPAGPRRRAWLVLLHRYVGLATASFLLLAGLTGTLLAWFDPLEAWINPRLMHANTSGPQLGPMTLIDHVQARYPTAWVDSIDLRQLPGHSVRIALEAAPDSVSGKMSMLENDEVFVDPATGNILGERKWGDITQGRKNLMPFIYRLHYSLALGSTGMLIMGGMALLWTLDCFVGAWLTLPSARPPKAERQSRTMQWLRRWKPAWQIRWSANRFKKTYDLHRAGGLWPWAMLLVMAWSSVGFNLPPVYRTVTGSLLALQPEIYDGPPPLPKPEPHPAMGWSQSLNTARALMKNISAAEHFQVMREDDLRFDPYTGTLYYRVMSSRDVSTRYGSTMLRFDGHDGHLVASYLPSGKTAGDTLGQWLAALHMAAVGGTAYRLFISALGIAVAALSVTGVIIWWRKRAA